MAQMIRLSVFLVSLAILTLAHADQQPVLHRKSRARAFVELQCQTTLYPDECVRCMSRYVGNFTTTLSHRLLAQIALQVSLARAESTKAYVTEVANELNQTAKGYLAVKECLDQINDGVEQLKSCINETQKINDTEQSDKLPWHASNVQTWMSAAQTDARLCLDGVSAQATISRKTKAFIKTKVLNLEQVTSNALALFNRFYARARYSHVN